MKNAQCVPSKSTKLLLTHPCIATEIQLALTSCLDSRIPRDQYLLDSLLSKYHVGSEGQSILTKAMAYASTLDDERLNARTNDRLSRTPLLSRNGIHCMWPAKRFQRYGFYWDTVVETSSKLIAATLGEFSYEIFQHGRFSSGASVGYRREHGDPWYKFNRKVTVTPNAVRYTIATIMCHPLWRRTCEERWGTNPMDWVKIVRGNEGFTVPKNAKTDRFACKEPTGNMLIQSAIGRHIRTRLKRRGIDLNRQERNRSLARLGSITGELATIDLKSASNSVTLRLCQLLLPPEWYAALMACRSAEGKIDGTWHRWEMISSMGNGFTFELESLIFWALSESVRRLTGVPGVVSVYGDDIIAPTACSHALIAVLNYAGFRVNYDKSFIKGPVRESCGGHYYHGTDITPIYIRRPITDTTRVIWFLNSLRRWATVGGGSGIADERIANIYFQLRRKFVNIQLWGGTRLSSITSLVTPHSRRRRLKIVHESRRLDGVGAVLRTFMYAGTTIRDQITWVTGSLMDSKVDRETESLNDPQLVYEMFGTIPISCSMSRLATVTDTITDEVNSEIWEDDYGLFSREVATIV